MITYIVRRLLFSIPVIVLASVTVFFGVSSVADPLAPLRVQPNVSQETLDNVAERKHLNDPLIVQYGYWVQDAVTNQFGTTVFGRPIWPELRRAIGHTLQFVVLAEILSLMLAVPLGILSARRQYSLFDYTTTTVSFLGYSMPIFWFALILQVVVTQFFLATDIRLFYTSGLSSPGVDGGFAFIIDRLQHLALPILALAYVQVAQYSRYMRSSMLEVINADYVRTARAKGLTEQRVMNRHALRNALIPIVTVAALGIGTLINGAIVTETIFSLDGMGLFFIEALNAAEVYEIMAFLIVTAVGIVLGNLIADVVYAYLDPRIRYD